MHIKSLKKANTLLQQLEALDKEIICIQKYAQVIQDQHLDIQLELSHKKVEAAVASFETYDSEFPLSRMYQIQIPTFFDLMRDRKETKEDKEKCKMEISEVIALQVLGVMIAHKEAERMSIINQLMAYGFEVNV